MARAKLIDDPAVAELVEKEKAKALAAAAKEAKSLLRDTVKLVKETIDNHVGDAKTAGNKDAAGRLKALGGDVLAKLKDAA